MLSAAPRLRSLLRLQTGCGVRGADGGAPYSFPTQVAELKKSQDKIASLEQILTEQAQKHQTVRTELEERLLSGLKERQQLAADKDLLMQVQMDAMEEIHSKKVLEV